MRTARKDAIGITYQKGKGFKKCIGWYQHEDGRRLPKIHWLGHEPEHARFLAFTLAKAWPHVEAEGRGWKADDIAKVKAFVSDGADILRDAMKDVDQRQRQLDQRRDLLGHLAFVAPGGEAAPAPAEPPTPAEPQRPMLYAAIAAYVASIKGKRKSDKHKERAAQVVEVNLKRVRQDCPLAEVDYAWLDSLCDHFKSRPPNLKDQTPLTPAGVKNVLTYLRLFFQWLDDSGWGGWEAPRKLLKPFKVRIDDLMTPVELRAAGTIRQFDTDTLGKLYKAATERQRAIMLASLFTGATQQELAVLEKSEFDLDAGTLHHFRNKTHVEGRFWLPSELVTTLRADFASRPGDPLAFRTVEGNPLVTFKDGRQTSDAVRQMWDDVREAAELPDALSFKYLRKYLADWMVRNGGEAMGQIALSHSRKTVLAKNYTTARDFDGFTALQRKMYAELKAAKVFDVEKAKEKPKEKAKAKKAA